MANQQNPPAQGNTAPDWAVIHHQINGGVDGQGESAVYLLVDKNRTSALRSQQFSQLFQPEIKRAVLIDGGFGPHLLQNLIDLITVRIPQDYCGTAIGPSGCLQFDSVVITHWDIDHYKSLVFGGKDVNLMLDDRTGLEVKFKADKTTDQYLSKVRCFKYGPDQPKTTQNPARNTPLTKIFIQWYNTTIKGGHQATGVLKVYPGPKAGVTVPTDPKANKELGPLDFYLQAHGTDTPNFFSIALGHTFPSEILGWNLFTDRPLDTSLTSYDKCASLTNLLNANDPWRGPAGENWADAPGFYIIGSRTWFLGKQGPTADLTTERAKKTNSFRTRTWARNGRSNQGGGRLVADIPSPDFSNPCSVMCLLVWRTDPVDFKQHRVSLYTGGDAEYEMEDVMVPWVAQTVDQIKCVKVGHHGSSASTSQTLIEDLKPDHYIFSAGRMHGHPTHDIIAYLGAWLSNSTRKPAHKPLHSVCYPYMLARVEDQLWSQTLINPNVNPAKLHHRWIYTHYPHPEHFIPNGSKDADYKNFYTALKQVLDDTYGNDQGPLVGIQQKMINFFKNDPLDKQKIQDQYDQLEAKIKPDRDTIKRYNDRSRNQYADQIAAIETKIKPDVKKMKALAGELHDWERISANVAWNFLAPWIKRYWDEFADSQPKSWPMKYFGVQAAANRAAMDPQPTVGPPEIGGQDNSGDDTDVQAFYTAKQVQLVQTAYIRVEYVQDAARDVILSYVDVTGNERIPMMTTPTNFTQKKRGKNMALVSAGDPMDEDGKGLKRKGRASEDEDPDGASPDAMEQDPIVDELILPWGVEEQLRLENLDAQAYEESLGSWRYCVDNVIKPVRRQQALGASRPSVSTARGQKEARSSVVGLARDLVSKLDSTSASPTALPTDALPFQLITASTTIAAAESAVRSILLPRAVGDNAVLARFIDLQFDGYLHLSKAVTADNISQPVALNEDDTLQMWLELFLSDARIARSPTLKILPSLSLSFIADTSLIRSFSFTLELTSVLTLRYESSTAAITAGYRSGNDQVDLLSWPNIVSPRGFLVPSTTLLLGLTDQGNVASTLTLADLYTLCGLNMPPILNDACTLAVDRTSQNCIWMTPGASLPTVLRISFAQSPALDTGFLNPLFKLPNVTIANSKFCGVRSGEYRGFGQVGAATYKEECHTLGTAQITATMTLHDDTGLAPPEWDSFMTTTDQSIELRLRRDKSAQESVLGNIVGWVEKTCGVKGFFSGGAGATDGTDHSSWLNTLTKNFYLREFLVRMDHSTGSWVFTEISITFEAVLGFGLDYTTDPSIQSPRKIPLLLKFSRQSNGGRRLLMFRGSLWMDINPSARVVALLNPASEMMPMQYPIVDGKTPQYYIYLPTLFTDSAQAKSFPAGIPQYVTMFEVDLSAQSFSFRGALSSAGGYRPEKPTTAILTLTSITIAGRYIFGPPASVSASLSATLVLAPRYASPQIDSARFSLEVSYNSGQWTLVGQADMLSFGALYTLLPESENDAVMNHLDHLLIKHLGIDYTYSKSPVPDPQDPTKTIGSAGEDFVVTADLVLGPVELLCMFAHGPTRGPKETQGWSLSASISPLDDVVTCSVLELLQDISPHIADELPYFIQELTLRFFKDKTQLDLDVEKALIKDAKGAENLYMIFSLILRFGDLDFELFQISDTQAAADTKTKRILRVTLDKLPSIPGIPMLDAFEQPFDQADLIWANDDFSRTEIEDFINPICVARKVPVIYFQDPRSQLSQDPGSDPNPPDKPNGGMPLDFVIKRGCHLMVIVEESNTPTIALDYPFLTPAAPQDPTPSGTDVTPGSVKLLADTAPAASPPAPTDQGATKSLTNTQGPLSISAIGLKYDAGSIELTFTATIKLGGLTGVLRGFGLRFPAAAIGKWKLENFSLLISGIEVSLVQPPLTVAGEFVKLDAESYFGGLVVGFEPYSLVAGGYYGKAIDPVTAAVYRSLFVFLMVDGPIADIGVVSLNGLKGGFGYNSRITLPKVAEVTNWCFLQDTEKDKDTPLKILDSFSGKNPQWIAPADGPLWFAAGATGKVCNAVSMQLVLVVQVVPGDVIIGLLAEATAIVPPDEADATKQVAKIDLGIVAQIDIAKGVASIEGQLSPSSFILSQACHLIGGFALYYWFQGSGHEGDWVLSLGGYHPAYSKPAWYPNPVPIGISWIYDPTLSITGGAYLAITPALFMVGAHMALIYNSGRIAASLTAYADALVHYSPFAFQVGIGAHLSFSYRAGVGCLAHTFSFEFSVALDVHGPPVAGVVHVKVAVVSFDIYFGAARQTPDLVKWDGFCALLRQERPGDKKDDQHPPETNLLRLSCTSGMVQDPSTAPGRGFATESTASKAGLWDVEASTFGWSVEMMMPVNGLVVNGASKGDGDFVVQPEGADRALSMKPMQILGAVTSTLLLTVSRDGTTENVVFGMRKVVTKVPSALFGEYFPADDPSTNPASAATSPLLDPTTSTTKQFTSLLLSTPPPARSSVSFKLLSSQLLKDVSTLPTDAATYRPAVAPQPLSVGQQTCLAIWNPTAPPTTAAALASVLAAGSSTSAFTAPQTDQKGQDGEPQGLLPGSWLKLSGAHEDGGYGQKLAKILRLVDGTYGGLPRSWRNADGVRAEFGSETAGKMPAVTGGRVGLIPAVVAIP